MAVETIYALFPTVFDAERAIGALMDHGVLRDVIGVVSRRPAEEDESIRVPQTYERVVDRVDSEFGEPIATYRPIAGAEPPHVVPETIDSTSPVDTVDNVSVVGKTGITTTTPEDAKAGAAIGSGIGLVTGMLAAAAALTVPGFGFILAGGAFAAAVAATVATTAAGAVAGGVVGYLRDMGMPQQAAEIYADRLGEGNYLISVIIDSSHYDDIKGILLKYNAFGVDLDTPPPTTAEVAANWAEHPDPSLPYPTRKIITEDLDGTPIIPVQVIEELPASGVILLPETPEESAVRLNDAEIEREAFIRHSV